MRSARLFLVAPAVTALVFAGAGPALASGGGHDGHDDTDAEVLEIDDEAWIKDDGDKVKVEFDYKCWGDEDDITTKVTLKQWDDDVKYEKEFDNELDCDGDEHTKEVTLDKEGDDEVEEGKAKVTVRFEDEDGDELDEESEYVEVEEKHWS
ncbi:hypothetical protein [Modestobacter marinus]|uniref:hypothetical protein n=1 Tax=Modestobacter marinus TaxID=477641 RepID=UPI001C96DA6E|nr:hypothetical protein [Modestobacter marinus]